MRARDVRAGGVQAMTTPHDLAEEVARAVLVANSKVHYDANVSPWEADHEQLQRGVERGIAAAFRVLSAHETRAVELLRDFMTKPLTNGDWLTSVRALLACVPAACKR